MENNFEIGINPNEENEIEDRSKKPSAWLIDDSQSMAEVLIRTVERLSQGNYDLIHFQEAAKAVERFKEICENKNQNMPEIILMDGNLTNEMPGAEIQTGVEAINKLKEIAHEYKVELPEIVAFSNSSWSNEEMLASGATKVVNKGRYSDVKSFINKLIEAK